MSDLRVSEPDGDIDYEIEDADVEVIKEKFDFYSNVALLGSGTINFLLKLLGLIVIPFKFIIDFLKFSIKYFTDFIRKTNKSLLSEAEFFVNDIEVAKLLIKQNKSADDHQKEKKITLLKRFFITAVDKHSHFLKRSINYVLPLISLIIFFVVVSAFSGVNFALDVTYNDTHIGYIESESVFRHAKELLEQRLEIGGAEYSTEVIFQPEYKIAIVDINELSDSNDICEQLIKYSDSGLTTSCGIYVDNKFIGSVKNESDASSVFKSYISAYCNSNSIDKNNPQFILDLVEKISYVQGLFPENTLMDSDDLKEYILTHSKSEISKYTIKNGDTVESVCLNNKLSLEQFFALNPTLDRDSKLKKGLSINVIKSIPFINVTVSKTQKNTVPVKFDTVEVYTDSLYKGVQAVIVPGVDGTKEVVNLVTYVDGKRISSKEIGSTVIKKPVDQKVYVGTKPVPNNVTILGSHGGAFVWPVIGANTVTSGFGYRYIFGGTSFHKGIDIAGPGANGKPIVASADGVIERVVSSNRGYGYYVLIDHGNGIKTRYAHCQAGSICVKPGQTVVQGQMIAKLGNTGNSTGPHLHFEIIYNGSYTNPINYLTR